MNLFYKSFVGVSILSLVACSDDSASSASKNGSQKGLPSEVSSPVDLAYYECDEELEGVSVYIKSAEIDYVCNGDGWFRADDPASEVRYSERNGNSKDSVKTDSTEVTDPEEDPEDSENTFTDARDGHVYRMVKIGSQVWMAQNLNFDYKVDGKSLGSYCYEDKEINCSTYGRLYTWSTAMDSAAVFSEHGKGCGNEVACTPAEQVRGICPEGWHLPNNSEWNTLLTTAGNDSEGYLALKSASGWSDGANGTDSLGFSALPAGVKDPRNDNDPASTFGGKTVGFSKQKEVAAFWMADNNESAQSNIQFYIEFNSKQNMEGVRFDGRYNGFSVRCIQD